MSTGYRCRAHVLWITLQLLVLANPDRPAGMAFAHFTPYVSEFEYSSRFHPSKNPDCPNSGWTDNSRPDFGSRRYRRSPEEGSPVGQEPSIEVRAILVRCPKTSDETDDVPINRNVYNITAGRSQDILDFHGFDRDEPARHSEVRDCRRKLVVTMKFNNIGRTKTQEEFVVIDHVLDPITMHKARLLNPFVVKVRQEPVLQLYGLKFQGVVNAEAREEVINKKLSNYTGCDDTSDNPTCGEMIFEGKPIPYSRGFCCSCDPELNVQRQASLLNESVVSSFPSFFSRSRETPIRPFKSPRSVSTDIRDTLADPDEIGDIASLNDPEKEDLPRSSQEFVENSKIAKIGKNLVPIGYDNSTIDDSHDDEQDLIKLKRTNKLKIFISSRSVNNFISFFSNLCEMSAKPHNYLKKENRYRPIWKTIFGEADDKKTIAPPVVFSPPGSSRQRSDFSKSVEKNLEISPISRQRSFDGDRHVDAASESRSSGREVFSNYRSTTDRYRSPYQNQRSVDLAAELTKLEEDYKNLRLSSIMRAADRNNEARDKIPVHKSSSMANIGTDYPRRHSPTSETKTPPLEDSFHDRKSVLSIDVKLALRPEKKSTTPPSSSIDQFSQTCSKRTSLPVPTTSPPSPPEARTPSVLRQKLVSDRVYPAHLPSPSAVERANVSREYTTEVTTDLSQKLDSYLADLLADAVMSDVDVGNSSTEDIETNPDETSSETSFVNSITESSPLFEGTAKYQHTEESSETNIDNPSDRAESPTDSFPILSSGNASGKDAILASGSLKNQLANWLPHEERNTSLVESAESKSKEQVGWEGEVRYGEIEDDDLTTVLEEADNPDEGHVRYEDRSTTVVTDRRPVQVYLGSGVQFESSVVSDDERTDENVIPRRRKEKALRKGFLDYPRPQSTMDLAPIERSRILSAPRPYRSIGEDDALFALDNDRQRSIDKRIDDEFVEISDALKEAADGSKIVREKPKSESTFEQDESVVRKFATIFGESIESRTELSKHTEPFVEPVSDIMLTTGHRIVVDRFKIVNDFQEIPAADAKPQPETASTDSTTNLPARIRDRKYEFPTTSSPKSAMAIGELFETPNYRIMVDRLELVDDFNEAIGKKPVHHRKSAQPISTEPTSTAKSEVIAAVGKDTSHWSAPSPVLTIDKLKKELRKEADRYSSKSQDGSILRDPPRHPGHQRPYNEVREVNTELTPAERVEDFVTDEETLPPDEETTQTSPLANTTHFPTTSSVDRNTINEYTFPRLKIDKFDARFVKTGRALPLKRANGSLVVLEEASPSSSQRPQRRGDRKIYERRHRHRDRHEKRSVKSKRNVRDSTTVRYIVRGGSENEDDEHPWYDATTESATRRANDRKNNLLSQKQVTNSVTTVPIAKTTQQNRKRRFYLETPPGSRDSDFPIDRKLRSTAGLFYLSITRIPENENRQAAAGLRIEEITKVTLEKSNFGSQSDEETMMKSMRWSDNSSEVDEMPIFRDIEKLTIDDSSDGIVGDKVGETIGRSKRNLQTFPAANSRKKERRVDPGPGDEEIGRNSKRNYRMGYFESEPEAQIFYDYEDSDAESSVDKSYDENSRSLGGFIRGKLDPVSDKKYLRGADESGDESSVKSSGIMLRAPDRRLIVERTALKKLNHRLNGRSGGERENERVSKNTDLLGEDTATESSASLDSEDHGRGHFSGNQFGIEPSDGWKEKMELLKLKKHADVLKEYLNWRQDVAPPESREVPGYTTMIIPTSTAEEQTSDFFTSVEDRTSDELTFGSNALSTDSTVTDGFGSTEERTDFTSARDDRYDAKGTTISGSVETSVIVGADDRSVVVGTDDRSANVEADNRSENVGADNRSVIVEADNRSANVAADNRSENVGADNRSENVGADDRSANVAADNRSENVGADNRSENVGADNRSANVAADNRSANVGADDRSVIVGADDRSVIVGADNRSANVGADDRSVILGADDRSVILGADDRSAIPGADNRSVDLEADDRSASCSRASSMTTTVETQTSTGCPENKTAESFRQEDESSTGRILPPCGYQNGGTATCRTDENATRSSTSRTPTESTRRHQAHLSDVDRDLIIISVLEKNRLENKTRFSSTKQNARSKIHRPHDDVGSSTIFQQHRRRHKSKNSEIPIVRRPKKNRHDRRAGRQLMALEASDEENDLEEYDRMFEDVDENRQSELSTSNGDEADSAELSQKWNRIIDKIIHENSTNSWRSGNSTDSSLTEVAGDSRSAMQQLHVKNADKYIRQIAKSIVHNTNIHEQKRKKDRQATLSGSWPRKLQSYMTARRKVVGRADKVEDFENYEAHSEKRPRAGSKIDDSCSAKFDFPDRHARPAPRSAELATTSSKETSEQDKTGRDFAISLSGKIHVEGGTDGQPMSISFDTAPEIPTGNDSTRAYQNGTSTLENGTKTDGEAAPSTNFLSSLFNIASVPKELPHRQQDENANSSANVSIRQSARDINGEPSRFSRENHGRKFPGLSRKYSKVRKSRAVDDEAPERFLRNREDRSYDIGQSRLLEDNDEDDELEDYPESSDEVNYSDLSEYDDKKFRSPERRPLNSRSSCPETNRSPAPDHSLNRPEVKVIKIIPLNAPEPHGSLSSMVSKHEETKASRMTASQLPKTEDDTVPGTTVKPGKIKPAELPDDASNAMLDTMEENDFPSKSSGSCSSDGNGDDLDARKEFPIDGRIPTSSPVSLRVVGLVGVRHPSGDSTGNANVKSDPNYAVIPLVHVKIQQQSENKEEPQPQPMEEGCPATEVTNPPEDLHSDQSPCQKSNDEGSNTKTEEDTGRPEVATISMENDEELREPVGIGSCPGSNQKDVETLRHYSNDGQLDRPQRPEVERPFTRNQETTLKTRPEDAPDGLDSRKTIRLKNMLAIMRFMKKIKEIMNNEEAPELLDHDDKDIVIKLDRVVVLPNDRSYEPRKKIVEPEVSTDRVVMMGEGVRHKPSSNGIHFEKSFNLSGSKGSNEAWSSPKISADFNETESGNGSSAANWKSSERDRDKSFLFYGRSDKPGAVNPSAIKESADRLLSPIDRGNANPGHRPNEEAVSDETHNIRLIQRLKNTQNDVNQDGDSSNHLAVPNDSQPNDASAVRNFFRNFEDRFRSVKDREPGEIRRANEVDDSSLIPKSKRHRSATSLRSDRTRYDLRRERDAKSQIYGRRSLPTGRGVSRFGGRKFGRYAAAKGVSKEKRARKKMKKRRRKKKKKKRKRKKGKSHAEAAVKGKAWWPFGRKLMSVSEEREIVSDSNFEQSQVERLKTKRHQNRRVSSPFAARGRRRVHRAKYPHEKKKKRRKHKKGKLRKRKKKKKTKGRGKGEKKSGPRNKRQIRPGGTQVRGGQDCMDRRHPPDINPAKYLESAHCLRFSDMWYSVYELESPITEHTVYLQLFEKHSLEDGTTHWDDLTQGTMVRMGTFTRHQRDSKPTIVFTYSGAKTESPKRALNLDPAKQRLLVPSPVPPKKASQYREGGSGEYLVVQADSISKDGSECDKAGVGFAAFSKQADRCGRAKGSCLRNQPLAYRRHDTEARESGRRGCYFLSNFASVPTNPIKYNVSGTGSREYLGLEYHSAHVSAIDIELRTDYNAIVRVGSSGRVTEVYVDSTAPEHTVVTVVISNMGLTSSPYQPRITDCPTGLPVSWTKAKGIMQVIPPQHDQRVTLDLYGQLSINGFHCSVEVVNHRGELVAMRRIRVQKMDRCFCVWHCLCACIGSVSGMGCQPMSPEHYHAAGFQGPVPVVTAETSVLMNAVKDVLMLSALLVLLLLLLGILKWFVGMFVPAVGRWGLDSLLEGSRIEKYLEPELKCRCVVTDDDGAPVHPDTGQRTVRICSRKLEFGLNFIFFLTYPIAICCSYLRRSLNASRQRNCCPDESKMCLIDEKGSCPKMICVSTYGDSRNSKLEAEDTRYVMNELKKSQESLENPKRTKKRDGHRNGSGKNLTKKSSRKNKSASDVSAKRFVDDLLKRRTVFRNLTEPVGGLLVPAGTTYSIRGYFLNAEDGGYRFITPCPFKQHWLIVNNQKKASRPPEIYPSSHFMRSFGTARDVYESNELSLTPKGVCVNVQYLEDS